VSEETSLMLDAIYNFEVNRPISIICSRNIGESMLSNDSLFSPPHLTSVSALPGKTWISKIVSFYLNTVYCCSNKHSKQLKTRSDYRVVTV